MHFINKNNMKQFLTLITLCSFLVSCSATSNISKPTKRQIRKGMKYSTWQFAHSDKSIYSKYR